MTRQIHNEAADLEPLSLYALFPDSDPRHETKPAPPLRPAPLLGRGPQSPILKAVTDEWLSVLQIADRAGHGRRWTFLLLREQVASGAVEKLWMHRPGRGQAGFVYRRTGAA